MAASKCRQEHWQLACTSSVRAFSEQRPGIQRVQARGPGAVGEAPAASGMRRDRCCHPSRSRHTPAFCNNMPDFISSSVYCTGPLQAHLLLAGPAPWPIDVHAARLLLLTCTMSWEQRSAVLSTERGLQRVPHGSISSPAAEKAPLPEFEGRYALLEHNTRL